MVYLSVSFFPNSQTTVAFYSFYECESFANLVSLFQCVLVLFEFGSFAQISVRAAYAIVQYVNARPVLTLALVFWHVSRSRL